MRYVRWYLRFRRFKEEALDLRRSSNMRRSLYVAASWGGWKDPLGIIVGGVDLGGMAVEKDTGTRQNESENEGFYPVVVVGVVRRGGRVVVAVCHDVWWRFKVIIRSRGFVPPGVQGYHYQTSCHTQTRKSRRRRLTSSQSLQPSETTLRIR